MYLPKRVYIPWSKNSLLKHLYKKRSKTKIQTNSKHACFVAVNVWMMILTSAAGLPPRETHWISTSRSSVVLRVSPLTMIGFSGGTFTVKTASRDRMGETPSAMSGDRNFHDYWLDQEYLYRKTLTCCSNLALKYSIIFEQYWFNIQCVITCGEKIEMARVMYFSFLGFKRTLTLIRFDANQLAKHIINHKTY